MTNQDAIENVRTLGRMFAIGLKEVTGKQIKEDSELMNGIAAYQILNLKGQWAYMDESIDVVMRIAYDLMVEHLDAPNKRSDG